MTLRTGRGRGRGRRRSGRTSRDGTEGKRTNSLINTIGKLQVISLTCPKAFSATLCALNVVLPPLLASLASVISYLRMLPSVVPTYSADELHSRHEIWSEKGSNTVSPIVHETTSEILTLSPACRLTLSMAGTSSKALDALIVNEHYSSNI